MDEIWGETRYILGDALKGTANIARVIVRDVV